MESKKEYNRDYGRVWVFSPREPSRRSWHRLRISGLPDTMEQNDPAPHAPFTLNAGGRAGTVARAGRGRVAALDILLGIGGRVLLRLTLP